MTEPNVLSILEDFLMESDSDLVDSREEEEVESDEALHLPVSPLPNLPPPVPSLLDTESEESEDLQTIQERILAPLQPISPRSPSKFQPSSPRENLSVSSHASPRSRVPSGRTDILGAQRRNSNTRRARSDSAPSIGVQDIPASSPKRVLRTVVTGGSQRSSNSAPVGLGEKHSLYSQNRVTRFVSCKVSEAKGLAKGTIKTYVRVYSDSRLLLTTTEKMDTLTPFWSEQIDSTIRAHEENLIFRLMGVIEKKGGAVEERELGFFKFFFDSMSEDTGKEKWYPLSTSKKSKVEADGLKLRFSIRFSEALVLPSDQYEALIQDLFSDPEFTNLRLLATNQEVSPKDRVEIANHLVDIAHALDCVAPFLTKIIVDEIEQTPNKEVLFRGNSIGTKALDYYMKVVGQSWLKTLLPLIKKIVSDNARGEIVSSKMEPTDDLPSNMSYLTSLIDEATETIFSTNFICPGPLREIFHSIYVAAEKQFPDDEDVKFTSVSGFLFLRFFVPAIMTPKLFHLHDQLLEGNSQRNCVLVATILQKLGNLVTFEMHETHFDQLNPWMDKRKIDFKNFMEIVCSPSDSPPSPSALAAAALMDSNEKRDIGPHLSTLHGHFMANRTLFEAAQGSSEYTSQLLVDLDEINLSIEAHLGEIPEIKKRARIENEGRLSEEEMHAPPRRGRAAKPAKTPRSLLRTRLTPGSKSRSSKGERGDDPEVDPEVARKEQERLRREREAEFAALKMDSTLFKEVEKKDYSGARWQCSCNWKNPFDNERCEMCGKTKPDDIDEYESESSESSEDYESDSDGGFRDGGVFKPPLLSRRWECKICLSINSFPIRVCGVCLNDYGMTKAKVMKLDKNSPNTVKRKVNKKALDELGDLVANVSSSNPQLLRSSSSLSSSLDHKDREQRTHSQSQSVDSSPSAPSPMRSRSGSGRGSASPRTRSAHSSRPDTLKRTHSSPITPRRQQTPPLTKAEINAKARELLAKGIDRVIVTAFIRKNLLALGDSLPPSPSHSPAPSRGSPLSLPGSALTSSSNSPSPVSKLQAQSSPRLYYSTPTSPSVSPRPITHQRFNSSPYSHGDTHAHPALDSVALSPRGSVSQPQVSPSWGGAAAAPMNLTPIKYAVSGPYTPKSKLGKPVCYVCRYEMEPTDDGLNAAGRFYHSSHFQCGRCKKNIATETFFPVTDQFFCNDCYSIYSAQ